MITQVLAKKYAVVASSGKPYFGSVGNASWAVCLDGVDNQFPEYPFGHQLEHLRVVRKFKKTAKSHWVGTKGKSSLPAVKQDIKSRGFKQFFARWTKDSAGGKDDSVEVFYA